jgi:hypothetical protein
MLFVFAAFALLFSLLPLLSPVQIIVENRKLFFVRSLPAFLRAAEDFGHHEGVADGGGGAEHLQQFADCGVGGWRGVRRGGRHTGRFFQAAQLMIKDLVKVRLELFIRCIDFLPQMPRVLSDLLRPAKVLGHMPRDIIADLGQFGVHNLHRRIDHCFRDEPRGRGLLRSSGLWPLARRWLPALRRWLLRLGCRRLTLLLGPSLRFGLSPHLRDALQELFNFVSHKLKFKVQS